MGDAGFIRGEEAVRAVGGLVARDENAKYLALDAEYRDEFTTLYLKGWAGDFAVDFSHYDIRIMFKEVDILFYSEEFKLRHLGSEDADGRVIYDDDLSAMPAREQARIVSEIVCTLAYANEAELSCRRVLRRMPGLGGCTVYDYGVLLWKDGAEPCERRVGNIVFRVEADSEALRRERAERAERDEPETVMLPFGQIVGRDYTRALFERGLREPGEPERGLLAGRRASMSLCDRLAADANAKYLTFDPAHAEGRSTLYLRGRDGGFRAEFLPSGVRVSFKGAAFEFRGGGAPAGAPGGAGGARVVYGGDMSARPRAEQLGIVGDVVAALAGADSVEVEDAGPLRGGAGGARRYDVRLAKEGAEPRVERVGNITFLIGPGPALAPGPARGFEGPLWGPAGAAALCALLSEGRAAKYLTIDLDLGGEAPTLHLRGRDGGFSVGLSPEGARVAFKGALIDLPAGGGPGRGGADLVGALPDGPPAAGAAAVADVVRLLADADSIEVESAGGAPRAVLRKRLAGPRTAVAAGVAFRVEPGPRPPG